MNSTKNKKKYPFCSILVLNYNGRRFLDNCFKSLRKINYPKNRYEVIMIDNASTDDSVKYTKKKYSWVKIVETGGNYGFGGGYNKGIPKAKGKYMIILNNDTDVEKDWLIELVKVANTSDKIGICGSKISDKIIGNVGEGHINIFTGEASQKDNEKAIECFWISDCSMLIKREVVEKMIKEMGTVYDNPYFMYFEEVDVCWRARLLGYDIYYVPTSVVNHLGSATAKNEFSGSLMKYYHYRNKIWTFRKNTRFPLTQLLMVPIAFSTIFMISKWRVKGKMSYGVSSLKYMFTKWKKTSELKKISLKDQLKILRK